MKDMIKNKKNRIESIVFIFILLCSLLLVYRDFVFGSRFLVSANRASDSYGQFYPYLLMMARSFDRYGFARVLEFSKVLGGHIDTYDMLDFTYNITLFGEDNLLYMFAVRQIVLMFVAGISIYFYSKMLSNDNYVAIMASFFYTFSGPVLVRQLWIGYIVEYALFAVWLWSFERAFSRKDYRFLPLGTLILLYNFNTYKIIIYAIVISTYIIIRLLWEEKISLSNIKPLLIVVLVPVLLVIIKYRTPSGFIAEINSAMGSNRFKDSVGDVGALNSAFNGPNGLFWSSKDELITLFCRTVGTDTPKGDTPYIGVLNYLEGPAFYCGLPVILMLIPIWCSFNIRKKVLSGLMLVASCIYILVNPLRIIANGFVKDTFKLSSFWIVVVFLYIFITGINGVIIVRSKVFLYIVVTETMAIVGLCIYCIRCTHADKSGMMAAIVYSLLYAFVFILYFVCNWEYKRVITILALCAIIEATFQGVLCVNHLETIDKSYINEKKGYNDYTVDALDYIYSKDPIRTYRIDKQYSSFGFNDSLAQDYYSYSYYIGGKGVGGDMGKFYDIYDVPAGNMAYTTIRIPWLNNCFDEYIGTKYILSHYDSIPNFGYTMKKKIGDVYVYENEYPLSMAYATNEYMMRSDYEKLPWRERNPIMLGTVIIDDDQADAQQLDGLIRVFGEDEVLDYNQYETTIITRDDGYLIPKRASDDEVLVLKLYYCGDEVLHSIRFYYESNNEERFYYITMEPGEEYVFEVAGGVENFRLMDHYGEEYIPAEMYDVQAYNVPEGDYRKRYLDRIRNIVDEQMEVTEFSGFQMKGHITVENDGILCTTIPYDTVYSIVIDGHPVSQCKANFAFTGCKVDKGTHEVEIIYGNKIGLKDLLLSYRYFIVCLLWMIILPMIKHVIDKHQTLHKP